MNNTPDLTYFLFSAVKKYPNKPAITMRIGFRTKTFTYTQIEELSKKVALFLEKEGVKKGDKVLICAPNSPYWIAVFWGCMLKGAVIVPLNTQSTLSLIERVSTQMEAKILFKHLFFKHELPGVKMFIIENLQEDTACFDAADFEPTLITSEDLAQIMYTSGTTGNPKGVMLSHGNMASNLLATTDLIRLNLEKDRILSILPLSHIFEQTAGFLLPFSKGVHIIYAHSYGALTALMQEYRITKMAVVPEFLQLFMSRIETTIQAAGKEKFFNKLKYFAQKFKNRRIRRFLFYPILRKFGKLDTVASGGAYLDPRLEEKWEFFGVQVLQGYGLTETSPCVTTNTFEEHRVGSSGKVIPGVRVKIAGDGEILVKGPNVFKGYFNDEQKTKESFTEDGWFKTGDLGYFDGDGFIYIKGRKKYMILGPSGQNIYPEDIEVELNKIGAVQDSCVIGLEREGGRVEIHAILLLKPEATVEPARIVEQANKNLASYQQIMAWSIWPETDFPRTVTRKIKKNDVIAWLQEQAKGKQKASTAPLAKDKLTIFLAQLAGMQTNQITPETQLARDLNLDSLMRVELIAWIDQELNVQVNEADIHQTTTVKDLQELIKKAKGTPSVYHLKHWPRMFVVRALRFVLQLIIFTVGRFIVWLRVEGKENLRDLPLPVLFMPNHISYLDPIVIAMALPWRIGIRAAFAGAHDILYEYFWFLAPFAEFLFNAFPIQRGEYENIKLGLDFMGQMLDDHYSIVVFPEGKMSSDGRLQHLKLGAGLMATEMDVYIVPVIIKGTREILPYAKIIPRKCGRVIVKFGKPMKFKRSDPYEIATKRIEDAMLELKKDN